MFPLYSPNIDSITVVRRGVVRRAKLYYLRGRTGKSARIAERRDPRRVARRLDADERPVALLGVELLDPRHGARVDDAERPGDVGCLVAEPGRVVLRQPAAIRLLESGARFDLMITDVGLPSMNGRQLADYDLVELNEAFAAQACAVNKLLEIDPAKVNVNGGAIALGHPLGCTGTKLTVQLLDEMRKRGNKYGMVSMCVGTGQGAASIFELL